MDKTELVKNSLGLEHTLLLEEYKLVLTFIFGRITGVTLTAYSAGSSWPLYTLASGLFSLFVWATVAQPLRQQLAAIHKKVKTCGSR